MLSDIRDPNSPLIIVVMVLYFGFAVFLFFQKLFIFYSEILSGKSWFAVVVCETSEKISTQIVAISV